MINFLSKILKFGFIILAFALLSSPAFAQSVSSGFPALNITDQGNGETTYSLSLQILALMTALTVLPSLVLGMTSFTRIIIVLSILRQAMGTQQTPPTQILIGLGLFFLWLWFLFFQCGSFLSQGLRIRKRN